MDADKTEKVSFPQPLPEEGEEEMGKTMMDIDASQFRDKEKGGKGVSPHEGTPSGEARSVPQTGSVPQESVDELLKKKRSLKERLGKLFGKKG